MGNRKEKVGISSESLSLNFENIFENNKKFTGQGDERAQCNWASTGKYYHIQKVS